MLLLAAPIYLFSNKKAIYPKVVEVGRNDHGALTQLNESPSKVDNAIIDDPPMSSHEL
jgi:hypothetical protein